MSARGRPPFPSPLPSAKTPHARPHHPLPRLLRRQRQAHPARPDPDPVRTPHRHPRPQWLRQDHPPPPPRRPHRPHLRAPSASAQTDPARDRKAALTQIGILFQNPDHQILFPTVEEELAFGLTQQNHSNPAQSVADLLQQENRTHWARAATHTLSQGQRHYLCLLSILLMTPQTLLLDEPFAGLDLPTQARLKRRLNALPEQIITITHDPATVAEANRILWPAPRDASAPTAPPPAFCRCSPPK